jgi:hypothetical protein
MVAKKKSKKFIPFWLKDYKKKKKTGGKKKK